MLLLLAFPIMAIKESDDSRRYREGHYYAYGTWIYVIDGHEYLKGQNYTHKENCTNSIHKFKP